MKKLMVFFMAAAIGSGVFDAAYAATGEKLVGGMGNKFVRGFVNTITGWIEVPAQAVKGYNTSTGDKLACATAGVFKGVWHGAGRTISGFGDMAGFWAADPADNEGAGIRLDAPYAWQTGVPHDMCKPSFSEGTFGVMGRKLSRGLGNVLFGFLELPGQLVKGIRSKAPDGGIVKGIWYWFSRELDGIYDVISFPLPNPRDTLGLPFDEKWPWSALGDGMK